VTDIAPRMLPPLDEDNREFWTSGARGELRLPRCTSCRRWLFPPTRVCVDCSGVAAYETLSGQGRVFTFTIARHSFNPAVPVPYAIAIVELVEQAGLQFTTNVVNCPVEAVEIGMPVRVLFEPHGEVFVPIFEPDQPT
jgi:hypothetical protein